MRHCFLIILGKIHFLLISANEFFNKIKRDGITILHGIHVMVGNLILPNDDANQDANDNANGNVNFDANDDANNYAQEN